MSVVIPSRGNDGRSCTLTDDSGDDMPDHINACTCSEHTGVCDWCGFKITVGPSGVEYGHARRTNVSQLSPRPRQDCPHRPAAVDPGRNNQHTVRGDSA